MSDPTKTNRVLVVVSNPLGGIRTYLLYNGSLLKESGYTFTFIAPQGQAFESFKQDVCDWPGIEYVDAPVRNNRCRLRQTVRRHLKKNRLSLIHSQGLRAGTETALANLGISVPHLMTLHDVIVPQNDIPGRLKWLKKQFIGHATSRIDTIIPVSRDCATNHLQHFPRWKRARCSIEMIHNGVDVDRLLAGAASIDADNSIRKTLNLGDDLVLAGFFGRFMPQKGFQTLLQALKILAGRGYLNKFRLIAAKDPHGYRGEYIREVERDDTLSKMVCFVDPVSDISSLLSQMDLLVMPSLWEACGLLALEAMVLGVPVVGSDAIGLREVLRETPSLTPSAGDPAALTAAIEQAIRSPCKQQAELFAPMAQTRFDNRVAAKKLLELYSSVAR